MVSAGNWGRFTAPADSSRQASDVHAKVEFFKPRDVSFYPVPKIAGPKKPLAASEFNRKIFEIDFAPKKLNCSLFVVRCSIRCPKKTCRNTLHYSQLDQKRAVVDF